MPVIQKVTAEDGWSNESIDYTVEAVDNGSGVAGYGIILSENKANTTEIAWNENDNNENVFTITDTKLYSFFVKDNAGNVSLAFDMAEPAKIEKTAPVISGVDLSTEEMTNKAITFTVNATDEGGSGIAMYRVDEGDWQASNAFEISDDSEHSFWVMDNAGNVSEVAKKTAENFDNVPPTINFIDPSTGWKNTAISVELSASDNKPNALKYSIDNGEWQDKAEFQIKDKKQHTFKVVDAAGNVSTIGYAALNYDEKKPELKEVTFKQENTNAFWKTLNFLTFGTFFNENITVTIIAEDNVDEISNASGANLYSIYLYDPDLKEVYKVEDQESNKIALKKDVVQNFKGTVKVVITDKAGNVTEKIDVTTGNSNLGEFNEFMIENDAPVISNVAPEDKSVHSSNFNLELGISDVVEEKEYSGLNSVEIKVNDVVVHFDDFSEQDALVGNKDYTLVVDMAAKTVNGVAIADWNKAKLTIDVYTYDNAGNAASKTNVVYFDQTAPVILGFDFSLTDNIDVTKEGDLFEAVTVEDYGFYFKEDVTVTVVAEDIIGENETAASGVKAIVYKAVDISGDVVCSGTADTSGLVALENAVYNTEDLSEEDKAKYDVNGDGDVNVLDVIRFKKMLGDPLAENYPVKASATFKIPANFKGQIYAYAIDILDNTPVSGEEDGFVHPNGSIIESADKHVETSAITITAPEKVATQNSDYTYEYAGTCENVDKTKDYDDTQKVPLYNSKDGIKFNVEVEDTYSGIREVKWTVVGGTGSGVVQIDNAGNLAGEGWTILDEDDDNLVNKIKGEVTVSGDSNNMVLLVELTDRAGNTSYDYYVFGNDITAPVISGYELSTEEWTNKPVYITVNAIDEKSDIVEYGIVLTENKDDADAIEWKTPAEVNNGTDIFEIADTKLYSFFVKDTAGNVSEAYDMTEPAKYETVKPVISEIDLSNLEMTDDPIKFSVISHDEGGSGIAGYCMDVNPQENWTEEDWANVDWQISNVFEISDDNEHSFWVKDTAGNISEVFKKTADNFDDVPPTITSIVPSTTEWTNETIVVTVETEDNKNKPLEYCMDVVVPEEGWTEEEWAANVEWKTSNQFEIADRKVHTFYVRDAAGNVSEAETYQSVNYDVKKPELIEGKAAVTFKQENANAFWRILNFLTFGNFFNEKVSVTIDAQDVTDSDDLMISNASGVASYSIYLYNTHSNEVYKVENQESNVFALSNEVIENFKGTIKVVITDKAGNVTEKIDITTGNSNLENFDQFMIENNAPVISDITPENDSIHKENFNFEFSISDIVSGKQYSGINSVEVKVNGTVVLVEDFSIKNNLDGSENYTLAVNSAAKTVNGVEIADWNKAKLEITVSVYDNAGNAATKSSVAYFDQTSPVISGFDFSLTDNIDVTKEGDLFTAVTVDDYGFYFKENVIVTIKAEDPIDETETVASGVETITYKAVDVYNGVVYEDTVDVVENKVSFEIAANFKGQIYAYATDKVGNKPTDCEHFADDDIDIDGFVHPNGSIVEDAEKHVETSDIKFTAPTPVDTQNNAYQFVYDGESKNRDADVDYDDEQLVPLYASKDGVKFTVEVEDTYSGIREVKWTVFEGEDGSSTTNTVTVDNAGVLVGAGWTILDEDNDNLVNKIKGELTITGNHNNMVLLVELTDRAGNTSYDYYVFGIDTTTPKIKVTYNVDNDEINDSQYTDFFKTTRTAKIVITERNFRAEDVVLTIKNTDGVIPNVDLTKAASWVESVDATDLDKTTYTTTIKYTADGDYTFDITYTDRAGNANDPVDYGSSIAPTAFTIDMTKPTVAVAYDNNDAKNGNYYKAQRIATITIVEHNFDPARVNIIGSASDNSAVTAFPALSAWSTSGDTHTATILYSADSKYTFDIEFMDKASNSIDDFVAHEFYVDKTMPVVSITGITDESANADDGNIGFVITATDTNFNTFVPVLTGVQMTDNSFVTRKLAIGSTGSIANGQTYTVTNIDTDGVYSITCTVVDMAGNEFVEVILEDEHGRSYTEKRSGNDNLVTFSVNRNGSTFALDDYTQKLVDTYYVTEVDGIVTIIEINPDPINESAVTLNGKELVKDTDYSVTVENGVGSWYKYSYKLEKSLFDSEGENNIVVSSKDKAENEAFSDIKDLTVKFVVDRTAPTVAVAGIKTNGRYRVDKQTVTLVPTDDGGSLKSLIVRTVDKNGEVLEELINLSGEELAKKLAEGKITFVLKNGMSQNVQIICEDEAGNVFGVEEDEIYSNITITTNAFLYLWANSAIRWSAIAAVVLIAAGVVVFIILKKKKSY